MCCVSLSIYYNRFLYLLEQRSYRLSHLFPLPLLLPSSFERVTPPLSLCVCVCFMIFIQVFLYVGLYFLRSLNILKRHGIFSFLFFSIPPFKVFFFFLFSSLRALNNSTPFVFRATVLLLHSFILSLSLSHSLRIHSSFRFRVCSFEQVDRKCLTYNKIIILTLSLFFLSCAYYSHKKTP